MLKFKYLLSAFLFIASLACADQKTARFGLILPLSGPLAQLGSEMRDASLLAYEHLPESERSKIRLVFEDDQFRSVGALSAYQKILQQGAVEALLAVGPQSIDPLISKTEQNRTIFFLVTGNGSYSDTTHALRLWANADGQAEQLTAYMKGRAVRRIGVVSSQHQAMTEYAGLLRRSPFEVVFDEEVQPGELDFRAMIARLQVLKPDGIVAPLLPPQLAQFSKQLRELKLNTQLYSFVNTEVKSAVELAAGAMNGIVYAAPVASQHFIDTFSARFGYRPQTIAASAYDAVTLFSKAWSSNSAQPGQVMPALRKLASESDGALGPITITAENEMSVPVRIKRIEEGHFVVAAVTQSDEESNSK